MKRIKIVRVATAKTIRMYFVMGCVIVMYANSIIAFFVAAIEKLLQRKS